VPLLFINQQRKLKLLETKHSLCSKLEKFETAD